MGLFVNGMLGGYGALLSELYPDRGAGHRRERAVQSRAAASAASGRSWSARWWRAIRSPSPSRCSATIYLLDIVATLLLIPEKKGQPLQ